MACIDTQTSSLSTLHVESNPVCFVNSLPTETLEMIFIHCARDDHSTRFGNPTLTTPSWVNVSYTCRRWRSAVLNCSTPWSYLFITSPRWTEELLARSKEAPLKVIIKMNHSDDSPELHFMKQVLNHAERIQEFCLYLPSSLRHHSLISIFPKCSSPAPLLQNLRISANSVFLDSPEPMALFGGDTPALRTLDLLRCPIQWHLFNLTSITTLRLRQIPNLSQRTMADLLATLGCIQDLTDLHIAGVLESATGSPSSAVSCSSRKICLLRLSRLLVDAPVSAAIALLSGIDIPFEAELRLLFRPEIIFCVDDYSMLPSLLARRFTEHRGKASSISSPMIRTLSINSLHDRTKLSLSTSKHWLGSIVSTVPKWAEWDCGVPLQVTLFTPRFIPKSMRDQIIGGICYDMQLPDVQRLYIDGPPSSSTYWSKMLRQFPALRYLKLSSGYLPDLAHVLSFTPGGDGGSDGGYSDQGPDQVLVPALQVLKLDHVAIFPPPKSDILPTAYIQSLYDVLASRKGSRGQLKIVDCIVHDSEHVTQLSLVGRWGDGHFRVVRECSKSYELDATDSDC